MHRRRGPVPACGWVVELEVRRLALVDLGEAQQVRPGDLGLAILVGEQRAAIDPGRVGGVLQRQPGVAAEPQQVALQQRRGPDGGVG